MLEVLFVVVALLWNCCLGDKAIPHKIGNYAHNPGVRNHEFLPLFAGKSGSGRIRAPLKKETKQNVTKKLRVANLSSGQTNGLNSSLVFTPVQVWGRYYQGMYKTMIYIVYFIDLLYRYTT